MLISGITQKYGENELVNYLYDYNDNSDVSAVYENGIKVARYVYGDMNQLSWYTDKNTGSFKQYQSMMQLASNASMRILAQNACW